MFLPASEHDIMSTINAKLQKCFAKAVIVALQKQQQSNLIQNIN